MNKCIKFLVALLLCALTSRGQEHKLGAILMKPAEFAKLVQQTPSLKAASGTAASGAANCPSVVMLTNPPVGDQGAQGSCVGWGVGYTALGILVHPNYGNWNTTSLRSPSYVYNQIKIGGCDDGSFIVDGLNLIQGQGSSSISVMPYNQFSCSTAPNATQIADASQNKSGPWSAISQTDVEEIKAAICAGYPVVIGFTVRQSFFTMWNSGGIWNGTQTGDVVGGHCVCIIGYDDNQQMFKAQNQWGTSGGDNGFLWISYNNVQNGCLNEAYRVHPGCASDIYISNSYSTPLKESNTWIRSINQTTIYSPGQIKLDADPINGYVLFEPIQDNDFLYSAPSGDGKFVAQALDGCGFNVPMKSTGQLNSTLNGTYFTLSPNPTRNEVFITTGSKFNNAIVELYDLNGRRQTVQVHSIGDYKLEVSWSYLSSGIYLLKISSDEHSEMHKLVITN